MVSSLFKIGSVSVPAAENLFGIALEDMNGAIDGGLNANMVRNHSFDEMRLSRKAKSFSADRLDNNRLAHWYTSGLTLSSLLEDGADPNSYYARVCVEKYGTLWNQGYNGENRPKQKPGYFCRSEEIYEFSCYIRNIDFKGTINVCVESEGGEALTEILQVPFTYAWQKVSMSMHCITEGFGKLVFVFEGAGRIDMDCIVFRPEIVWNQANPEYRESFFRKDLVEKLAALKPDFIRFPGISLKSGIGSANEYDWKKSVGPLIGRVGRENRWAFFSNHQEAYQSLQIGVYEYFCLCEDLMAEPVPVLSVAANRESSDSVLGLLSFALDKRGEYAKMRSEAGHKKPFDLHFLAVNVKELSPEDLEFVKALEIEISLKYPQVRFVFDGEETANADRCVFSEYGNTGFDYGKFWSRLPLQEAAMLAETVEANAAGKWRAFMPALSMSGCNKYARTQILFNPAYSVKTTAYMATELVAARRGDRVPELEGQIPGNMTVAVSEDYDFMYIHVINQNIISKGVEFALPFARGTADIALLEPAKKLGENRLSFYGEPHYVQNVRNVTNEIYDGCLGLLVPPLSLASIAIRKEKE